ncbi:MAG: hypothetical protein ACO24B_01500 [Ilumatobacteraceae bacterium]
MFESEDEQNLIEDIQRAGIALLVLLGIRNTGQRVRFDSTRSQFIVDGRRINYQTIQRLLRRIGLIMRNDMREITNRYFDGRVDLDEWQRVMARKITSGHWASTALVKGGLRLAAQSSFLRDKILQEIRYADRFKADIAEGRASRARAVYRAGSYSDSMRGTASNIEQGDAVRNGAFRAYRIQLAEESCPGCVAFGGRWMPVSEMPAIGTQECGSHCKCVIIYQY